MSHSLPHLTLATSTRSLSLISSTSLIFPTTSPTHTQKSYGIRPIYTLRGAKLRSAFVSAVWSLEMPLATTGAILSLLDGIVAGWFARFVRINFCETNRFFRMFRHASLGCADHGPFHLLVKGLVHLLVKGLIGSHWGSGFDGWSLRDIVGPTQHFFKVLMLMDGGPRLLRTSVRELASGMFFYDSSILLMFEKETRRSFEVVW